MQMAQFIEALQADLRELAEIGGEELVQATQRLAGAIKQSATLRLIDALTQIALDLSEPAAERPRRDPARGSGSAARLRRGGAVRSRSPATTPSRRGSRCACRSRSSRPSRRRRSPRASPSTPGSCARCSVPCPAVEPPSVPTGPTSASRALPRAERSRSHGVLSLSFRSHRGSHRPAQPAQAPAAPDDESVSLRREVFQTPGPLALELRMPAGEIRVQASERADTVVELDASSGRDEVRQAIEDARIEIRPRGDGHVVIVDVRARRRFGLVVRSAERSRCASAVRTTPTSRSRRRPRTSRSAAGSARCPRSSRAATCARRS